MATNCKNLIDVVRPCSANIMNGCTKQTRGNALRIAAGFCLPDLKRSGKITNFKIDFAMIKQNIS